MKKRKILRTTALALTLSMLITTIPTGIVQASEQSMFDKNGLLTQEMIDKRPQNESEEVQKIITEETEKRDAYTKYFLTEQNAHMVAMYPDPVHYEEDGQWKDIDNTLTLQENEDNEQVYQNIASNVQVQIAKTSDTDELVSIERDGIEISWGLAPQEVLTRANKIEEKQVSEFIVDTPPVAAYANSIEKPETPEEVEEYNMEQAQLSTVKSSGMYSEILPNIDIQYVVQSNTVKENIILKDRSAVYETLSFKIQHPNLKSRLNKEENSISIYQPDTQQIVYEFVPPFMYDNNGEMSDEVAYQLESQEGYSILTIVPDTEWLLQDHRAYPVVIDPYTETSKGEKNIVDTYIYSGKPTEATTPYHGSFLIGNNYAEGSCRAYIKFTNLPQLSPGDIIYKGQINIWQYQFSAVGEQSFNISTHETSEWGDSITWNTAPWYSGTSLDYVQLTPNPEHQARPVTLDITKLVRDWYNTGKNYGIMIKSESEGRKAVARFFTSNYPFNTPGNFQISGDGSQVHPSGVFYYKNASGLEEYWSYHEQSAGQAGTGHTNDYTGNLVWTHDDTATISNRLPITVSHIYNYSESQNNTHYGFGWRINAMEKFESSGIKDFPYVYTDSDGTKHYFYQKDGKYIDEDGLGMEYVSINEANGNILHKVTLKDKTVLKFYSNGLLARTIDTNNNTIVYNYEGDSITDITDGAGNRLNFYYGNGMLNRIVDEAGRVTEFNYENLNLTRITYPDGTESKFEYGDDRRLTKAISPDGYNISYDYTRDMRVNRVSEITEYGTTGAIGQRLRISYRNGNTTIFESCGMDGNFDTPGDNLVTTCQFDNMGKPVSIYDQDGNANSYQYYMEGQKRNKLSSVGSTQATACNPVLDPGFEEDRGNWKSHADQAVSYDVNYVNDQGYFLNTSLKVSTEQTSAICGSAQNISLPAGNYVLSGYIKTENVSGTQDDSGAALVAVINGQSYYSTPVTGTTDAEIDGGWQKVRTKFTLSGETMVTVRCDLVHASGTAWFDSIQIDRGETDSKFNLIYNPSFEDGQYRWGSTITPNAEIKWNGNHSAKMESGIGVDKNVGTNIQVSGKEGDIYMLSGWVKADLIPKDSSTCQIAAAVIYNNHDPKWVSFDANKYVGDWQYISGVVSTDDNDPSTNLDYVAIHVYLFNSNNPNPIYFDGIQLIKDDSQSFVYDNEGNLISAKTAAENSGFSYDENDNISKLVDPSGRSFEYAYDKDTQNLMYAKNSDGVEYKFHYDANGNPTNAKIFGGDMATAVHAGQTYRIRNKVSGKYLDLIGNQDVDNGNVAQYEYTGQHNQEWKLVDAGSGFFKIESAYGSHRVLDLEGGSTNEGVNLVVYQNSNSRPTQKFKFKALPDGSYHIVANTDDFEKVLDLQSSQTQNGANVGIWGSGVDGNNYHWYLEPVNEEFSAKPEVGKTYVIRSLVNGKYAEIKNSVTDNTAEFIQGPYSANPNQMFTIVQGTKDPNTFMLSPGHAKDKVLSLTDHGISLEDPNDPTGQQLSFEKCPNGSYKVTLASIPELAWRIEPFQIYEDGKEIIYFATRENTDVYYQWIFEEVSDVMLSSIQYNADSLVQSTTDNRGNVTSYTYNNNTNTTASETSPNGLTVNYTYNHNTDQLLSTSSTINGNNVSVNYDYSYNNLTAIHHNGFTYSFIYDAFGNLEETKVGNQRLSRNTYLTNNGNLDTVQYGNGDTIKYHYDKYGYETQRDYNGTPAYRFQYDTSGNLVRYTDLTQNVSYQYQYDKINRSIGMDSTNGQKYYVHYDDKNRIDYDISKVNGQSVKTSYLYSDTQATKHPDQIQGIKINDTQILGYEYDNLARLSKRNLQLTTPFTTQYTYLQGNSIGTTTDLIESITNGDNKLSYTYDESGNITTISENGELKATYCYDEISQLVREDNLYLNKTITYSYDNGGNLLSVTEYPYTTGDLGTATATVTYSYEDTNWKDKLTNYNGQAITYDEIGNPLQYRDGMNFTWEKGRRLSTINDNISYQYNLDGIRTQKIVDGKVTNYYLNGSTILTQVGGNDRLDFYYDHSGSVSGFNYNGTSYYYIFNAQLDVIGILDSNGNTVVNYSYDSWGNPISITGSMADTIGQLNPFRYRRYYYDTESGLYYLQSRYYDPVVKRFVNADDTQVLSEEQDNLLQYNLFSYCLNNPVNMADETGYMAGTLAAGGSAVAGLLSWLSALGGANFWNPVGWVLLGTVAVLSVGAIVYASVKTYQASKASKAKKAKKPKKKSKQNGKERATDAPSWAKRKRPKKGESAQDFTNRILSEKYGKGNYSKGGGSEYSEIKKWAHRSLGLK